MTSDKTSHSDHAVHVYVVVVGGYVGKFLEVEADAYLEGLRYFGQEAVVVALAATEAVAVLVEGHARHYCNVDVLVSGICFARWSHYPVMSGNKVVGVSVNAYFHVLAVNDTWQEHRLAGCYKLVYGMVGIHFVRQ